MAFEGTLQEITVRMHGNETRDARIEVQQGDTASRKVRIQLKTFGGADYIVPYGARAVLCISKNDGKKVYDECEIEDKNTLLVTLSDQAISCSGFQKAQIYIFSEEGDIKTQVFQVNVPKAVYSDDAIESSDEFGILHELIVENSAIQQAEQIRMEAETERVSNEEERQANAETMVTATEACLAVIEDARAVAYARGNAIVQTASGTSIVVKDSSDDPVRGLRLFGRTTQEGTPAPDAPVPLVSAGDAGSVEVGVYGKNLLENIGASQVINGVTFTVNTDGSVTADGTATKTIFFTVNRIEAKKGVSYILSGCAKHGSKTTYSVKCSLTGTSFYDIGEGVTFIGDGITNCPISIRIEEGVTVSNLTFRPMLRLAEVVDNTFEPYHKQSLTIPTPNGLPGIKVTDASLATYTDSDGNMWCCDEVDFERGVYVQRVFNATYDGSDDENIIQETCDLGYRYTIFLPHAAIKSDLTVGQKSMNSNFPLARDGGTWTERNSYTINIRSYYTVSVCFVSLNGNESLEDFKTYLAEKPMTVLAILATPIETPLTAEELAQYASIHTNYPVTTVLNDAGAHMEFSYNADTKTYIDNKFAELQTALVALGGN